MLELTRYIRKPPARLAATGSLAAGASALLLAPAQVLDTVSFVSEGLVDVAPLVIPGIAVAAWIMASGASDHIRELFGGRIVRTVFVASLVGALTPVCGVTVLPLMTGLLASGVPVAPVMAFWLSSPITDPAMLAATAATLGMSFAIGKTLAAFGLGVFGGVVTALMSGRTWVRDPLRNNWFRSRAQGETCGGDAAFVAAIWRDASRRHRFRTEAAATTRLILICLIPAFAAEYWLNELLYPQAVSAYVGSDAWWAVPLAVLVGAPAYLDGYAALPLTRSLMDHGMSRGAAMAFLVSGGAVSIWGAMAVFPVLKLKPFLLLLGLAVFGSMASGWIFGALAQTS